jgi:hypothetical protein
MPVAGDTLKVWKSDRWGGSAGHVLTTVTELRERGLRVVSLTENFDLETAERQAEGIAAAKRREAEGRCCPASRPAVGPGSSARPNSQPCAAWSTKESRSPKQPAPSAAATPRASRPARVGPADVRG